MAHRWTPDQYARRKQALLSLLEHQQWVRTADVAAVWGLTSIDSTTRVVAAMIRDATVVRVGSALDSRITLPERADEVREQCSAGEPFVHVIVPAGSVPPPRIKGPRSVWDLAALCRRRR